MAAVPITIIGIQTDESGSRNVTITVMASLTGIGVGGGPILPVRPAHPIAPGGPPPHPEHPIVIPPEIWPNPPEGTAPHPEHPIVIPPPDGSPPGTPAFEVHTLWTNATGWMIYLTPAPDTEVPTPS